MSNALLRDIRKKLYSMTAIELFAIDFSDDKIFEHYHYISLKMPLETIKYTLLAGRAL